MQLFSDVSKLDFGSMPILKLCNLLAEESKNDKRSQKLGPKSHFLQIEKKNSEQIKKITRKNTTHKKTNKKQKHATHKRMGVSPPPWLGLGEETNKLSKERAQSGKRPADLVTKKNAPDKG